MTFRVKTGSNKILTDKAITLILFPRNNVLLKKRRNEYEPMNYSQFLILMAVIRK